MVEITYRPYVHLGLHFCALLPPPAHSTSASSSRAACTAILWIQLMGHEEVGPGGSERGGVGGGSKRGSGVKMGVEMRVE